MLKINSYSTHVTLFNPKTGERLRHTRKGFDDPEWCPDGPELADISITDFCDFGCDYCYRDSKPENVRHMSVYDFREVLEQLSPHVLEVAIGGGSPQHHPQFIDILATAHSLGVVPNYTSNGKDMTPEIIAASKKYCGAVAISMHNYTTCVEAVENLLRNDVKTSIHVVLSLNSIAKWTNELLYAATGSGMLGGMYPLHSCVFLMHKPMGRGTMEQHPTYNQKKNFFAALREYVGPVPIAVDSCSVPSLVHFFPEEDIAPETIGPCDSGMFSVFVDENLVVSPCSFNDEVVYDLHDLSFEYIWKEMFKDYREEVLEVCPECDVRNLCRGCLLLPEINPCHRYGRTC